MGFLSLSDKTGRIGWLIKSYIITRGGPTNSNDNKGDKKMKF